MSDKPVRPLSGVTILVTRPQNQAARLCDQLSELGAEIILQPAIEISPPHDWSEVDRAIDRLAEFDWLVFSSTNGVDYFLGRVGARGKGEIAPRLADVKLAAIGPGTAKRLERFGLEADLVPREYRAESLAESLIDQMSAAASPTRFLLARASRGRPVLRQRLTATGAVVEEIVVYTSRDVDAADPKIKHIAAQLEAGRINWATVTSSAIARSLVRMFGKSLHHTKLASISPITSGVLAELGYPPAAEADQYTIEAVGQAILKAEIASQDC